MSDSDASADSGDPAAPGSPAAPNSAPSHDASDAQPAIEFHGGAPSSAVPLAVFVIVAAALVLLGAPKTEGLIFGAMLGLSLGLIVARRTADYGERVFSLMADRTATVAVVCWLWAGLFAGILADSKLVEAIVWIAWKVDLTGAAFTTGAFLSAALFAVSVGTGLGTVVGFTAVMYPAGIILGAHPGALMGAIFSGAAFGDNLAPISDTTIVSAATQGADVGGVVRSRLRYVLAAGAISAVLFFLFGASGSGGSGDAGEAARLLKDKAKADGLPMLIPGIVVFLIATRRGHFLVALTCGIASAVVIGAATGVFALSDVVRVDGGEVTGSAIDGLMALVPTAILTLLLVASIGILGAGGALRAILDTLERSWARTARGAEALIVALISLANICVSVNTVAMITTGPLANEIRKRHGIHAYRAANLLDTVSCSFPYILPYAATITAATAIQQQVHERYAFAPVLDWSEQAPYIFYGIVLFPLMCLAVATGFGRRTG